MTKHTVTQKQESDPEWDVSFLNCLWPSLLACAYMTAYGGRDLEVVLSAQQWWLQLGTLAAHKKNLSEVGMAIVRAVKSVTLATAVEDVASAVTTVNVAAVIVCLRVFALCRQFY